MNNNRLDITVENNEDVLDLSVNINQVDLNVQLSIGDSSVININETGLPEINADDFSHFDVPSNLKVGTYKIVGLNPGIYIGKFSYPYFQQMVIWKNNIYTRVVNFSTFPAVYNQFKLYSATEGVSLPDIGVSDSFKYPFLTDGGNILWASPYNGLDSISIEDGLLAATQGKILNDKIIEIDNNSLKSNTYSYVVIDELDYENSPAYIPGQYGLFIANGFNNAYNMSLDVKYASDNSSGGDGNQDLINIIRLQTGEEYTRFMMHTQGGIKEWSPWKLTENGVNQSTLDSYMLTDDYVGANSTGIVRHSEIADNIGSLSESDIATLDINGNLTQNIYAENIIGIIGSDNLFLDTIDYILNVKFWTYDNVDPILSAVEGDYWYDTTTTVLNVLTSGVWVESIPVENVIYNDISVANESHSYRWSGSSMVSIDNPISFATKQEAEDAFSYNTVMSPARTMDAYLHHISNKGIRSLTTSNKTIDGAINELNTKSYDALSISYHNVTYPTVEAALDKLLYVPISISSFTTNVSSPMEKGFIVNSITFNWAVNKTPTSQSINNGVGSIAPGTTTKSISSANVSSNTTWTLSVGDGTSTSNKSVSLLFYNRLYWGTSALTTLNDSDLLSLSREYYTGASVTKIVNASGGKYIYFAIPHSYGVTISDFVIGTSANSDWQLTTRNHTNSSKHTELYDIFRSTNLQNGSSITVKIL